MLAGGCWSLGCVTEVGGGAAVLMRDVDMASKVVVMRDVDMASKVVVVNFV